MNVLFINGSPRPNGNTATILGWVNDELTAGGHTVSQVNICKLNIKGCTACYACQKTNDFPGCIQQDDLAGLRDAMVKADAIIYGSPVYMWGFPAQLKALFDRHVCFVNQYFTPEHSSLLDGKPIALVLTSAGPVENNAELALNTFTPFSNYAKFKLVGPFPFPGTTEPAELGDEAKARAKEVATAIQA